MHLILRHALPLAFNKRARVYLFLRCFSLTLSFCRALLRHRMLLPQMPTSRYRISISPIGRTVQPRYPLSLSRNATNLLLLVAFSADAYRAKCAAASKARHNKEMRQIRRCCLRYIRFTLCGTDELMMRFHYDIFHFRRFPRGGAAFIIRNCRQFSRWFHAINTALSLTAIGEHVAIANSGAACLKMGKCGKVIFRTQQRVRARHVCLLIWMTFFSFTRACTYAPRANTRR